MGPDDQGWCQQGRFFIPTSVPRADGQINVNSWIRDPYIENLCEGLKTKPMPEAIEDATEVVINECEKLFKLFGCIGKA